LQSFRMGTLPLHVPEPASGGLEVSRLVCASTKDSVTQG
jgi:hypothetical protein